MVLMASGRVLGFGDVGDVRDEDAMARMRELKPADWLIPRAIVAGERSAFLLC